MAAIAPLLRRLPALLTATALLSLAFAGTASAGTYSFDLAADYAPLGALPPNPFSDSFGHASAWTFMEAVGALSRTPTPNPTLYSAPASPANATTTPYPGKTMATLYGSDTDSSDSSHLPFLSEARGTAQSYRGTAFPTGHAIVSPSANRNAIIAFTVPAGLGGTWSVAGSLADANTDCGDGIGWFLDKGATNLSNGTLANHAVAPATISAANQTLAAGDVVYLTITPGANGNALCDGTDVTLTMQLTDNAPPAPTISATSPPARTRDQTPVFSGTAGNAFGDASTVTVEIFNGTNTGVPPVQTLTPTRSATAWSAQPAALPEGDYTVRVTQADTAVTPNTGTSSRTVTIDQTAPVVTLTTFPAPVTTVRTPTLSGVGGHLTGDSATVAVKLYPGTAASGTPAVVLAASVNQTDGTYTATVPGGSPLADGTYTAQAEQTDDAGNLGTSTPPGATFRVDSTAPAPTVTAPGASSILPTRTPTVTGTASQATGDDTTVDVKVYSGAAATGSALQTTQASVGPDGTWSVATADLGTDGQFTVTATQGDSVNNRGTSPAITFTVDTAGPLLSLGQPTAVSENQTPTFGGSTNDTGHAVVVKIYSGTSAAGTPVQTLSSTLTGSNYASTAATTLSDGTYTAQAEEFDGANTGHSPQVTFQVDVAAPALTMTSPSAAAALNTATPTVSGAAGNLGNDNQAVTVKVYNGPTTAGTLLQTLNVTRNGASYTTALASLTDGTYTTTATQADSLDGQGGTTQPHSTTVTRTFSIDTVAPTVTLSAPADGSATQTSTPLVAGTASESNGTVTVKVYQGTAATGTAAQTLTPTATGTSYSVSLGDLSEGTYTIQSSQQDVAGNTGKSPTATIRVDTTTPTITLATPATNSRTNDSTPTLSGVAGHVTGDASTVTVLVKQGATTVQTLPTARGSDGAFTVDSPALADGAYTATVTQVDDAGNSGSSAPAAFVVDTVAPAPTLTAPVDNSSTATRTPAFSGVGGTASGDAANVIVKIYSGSTATGTPVQTLTAPVGSGGAYSAAPGSGLADGPYTAVAQQSDGATNTGTSGARHFTVDATAPTVTLTQPASPSATNTPTLSGSAGHAAGDSAVTVKVYLGSSAAGTPVQSLSATPNGSGTWTVDVSPALADATYTALATQTDSLSNLGSSVERVFRIDTAAPAPAITSPAGGATIAGTTPAFAGTAGHVVGDNAVTTVSVYSGATATGTAVQTLLATVGADGSWAALGSGALTDGTYTAVVSQADDAGHTGVSAPVSFVVHAASMTPKDTTPPTAAVTLPVQSLRSAAGKGHLFVNLVSSEPSAASITLAVSKATAKRIGLTGTALPGTHGYVAIGQLVVPKAEGSSRRQVTLTSRAKRALRKAHGLTVVAFGAVVDTAGNRTDVTSKARLTR